VKRVLIVGRPNVGKSSLFNRLVRRKKALVINKPGITRDILKQKAHWWGTDFEVWDSGGLWSKEENWSPLIDKKVKQAITKAHLVVFVMDAQSGLLADDKKTFQLIKKSGKKFITLVNKVDEIKKTEALLNDFYSLGVDLLPCAFEKDRGVSETVEWVLSHSPKTTTQLKKENDNNPGLLLLGKTNVGKSTLCNALLKQDRMLTSPVAGTTMDIVEDQFNYNKKTYILLDTAGKTKKPKKIESLVELKTSQSFSDVDIVLLLVDYSTGPGRQDAKLLQECVKAHKAVIIVVNKWDLSANDTKVKYRESLQEKFRFYPNIPIVFISALNNMGLTNLMKKVEEIYIKLHTHITTSELNVFLKQVTGHSPLPVYGTSNVKFYYVTQTHHTPPSFIFFANYPEGVKKSYRRFLSHQIQKKWNLKGIPIRISIMSR